MAEQTQLTAEEKADQLAERNANEALTSTEFLLAHVADEDGGFAPSPANSRKMADFIKKAGLDWSRQSLETAYSALRETGAFIPASSPSRQVVRKETIEEIEEVSPYPWGKLTVAVVRDMSGRQIQKWLANKQWGEEFRKQLDALQITRGQLRS